jgi:NADPH2:quinone reductase
MSRAIRLHQTGGPEFLQWEEVEVGEPGPGQARIRHTAVGVNLIDTYHRSGLYPLPLPNSLGREGAGVVEAVGPGVTYVQPGDRVAYGGGPPGTYAEMRVLPADRLVKIPEGITEQQLVRSGQVKIEVHQTHALRDAQQTHRDLADRKTTGSIVMLP